MSNQEGQEIPQSLVQHFEREERKWRDYFKKIAAQSPVRWLDRDTFHKICDARFRANAGKPALRSREWIYATSLLDLRSRVLEPPLFTPPDGDFAGPVERWYGAVGEHLFTIDYHYAFASDPALAFLVETVDLDSVEAAVKAGLDAFFAIKT
jgi:hypothetical protein